MRFDVLTLFPDMIEAVLRESVIGRGIRAGHLSLYTHQIRDYTNDPHRRVDDTPCGGGYGMLMAPQPVVDCHTAVLGMSDIPHDRTRTIYLSPQGSVLTQKKAASLAENYDRLILICGHYEGIDARAIELVADEEISIGDYVLTGGELAACVLCDAVGRLIDGVLADPICHENESIACGLLEYPQYTRPREFRGLTVPDVLLGGSHADIDKWRYQAALEKTRTARPDLL